jgi:hypothetical protein
MAPITVSVDVALPAAQAFAYVTDPSHMPEWQQGCRSGELDGPIRALVGVTVEPLADAEQSRVRIDLDFTGHGIGRLLVPLFVRRQAAKEMQGNIGRLKQRLEAQSR